MVMDPLLPSSPASRVYSRTIMSEPITAEKIRDRTVGTPCRRPAPHQGIRPVLGRREPAAPGLRGGRPLPARARHDPVHRHVGGPEGPWCRRLCSPAPIWRPTSSATCRPTRAASGATGRRHTRPPRPAAGPRATASLFPASQDERQLSGASAPDGRAPGTDGIGRRPDRRQGLRSRRPPARPRRPPAPSFRRPPGATGSPTWRARPRASARPAASRMPATRSRRLRLLSVGRSPTCRPPDRRR